MRRVESIIVEGKRSQERRRRTSDEQIKVDLHELNLSEGLIGIGVVGGAMPYSCFRLLMSS